MGLFEDSVNKVLNEEFENSKFYVYHLTKKASVAGISETGFERYFTGSNAGNMYGPGLYTTYDLSSSEVNLSRGNEYGGILLKILVKSLRNFVIWDQDIALKQYGTASVDDQLKKILPPDKYDKLRNYSGYEQILKNTSPYDSNRTSLCARNLWHYLCYQDKSADPYIDGFIFYGNRDGKVCVVRDFARMYPVEISLNGGRTFEPFKGGERFDTYAKDDIDLHWQLKKLGEFDKYDEVPQFFSNDFARVQKNGRYNYLYRKNYTHGVISPIWFDHAPKTFSNKGVALVNVNGEDFFIKLNQGNKFWFGVYNFEGKYLCMLRDFEEYMSMRNHQPDTYDSNDDEDWG